MGCIYIGKLFINNNKYNCSYTIKMAVNGGIGIITKNIHVR